MRNEVIWRGDVEPEVGDREDLHFAIYEFGCGLLVASEEAVGLDAGEAHATWVGVLSVCFFLFACDH